MIFFFIVRLKELSKRINEIETELQTINTNKLTEELSSLSLSLLKDRLFENYHSEQRLVVDNVKDIRLHSEEFCKQYPVILSTTFSARTAIPNQIYDYLIMDEASQVAIETGALALTCAKNAVIVGDTMQLPNVVKEEDRIKLMSLYPENENYIEKKRLKDRLIYYLMKCDMYTLLSLLKRIKKNN